MTDVVRVDPVLPITLLRCKSGERVKGLDGEEATTLTGAEVAALLETEQPPTDKLSVASASATTPALDPTSPYRTSPSSTRPSCPTRTSSQASTSTRATSPSHSLDSPHTLPSALNAPWALVTSLHVPTRGLRPTNENRAANLLVTHVLAVTMRVGMRPEEGKATAAPESERRGEPAPREGRPEERDRHERRRSGQSAGIDLDEMQRESEEKLFDVTIRMPIHVYSHLCTPDALSLPMESRHMRRVAEAASSVMPWL
ncbi:hypothetical protein HDZ31DRAFT_85124 [Schizophyllum fasciatum]